MFSTSNCTLGELKRYDTPARYCDEHCLSVGLSVCLEIFVSVCLQAYLRTEMSKLHLICYTVLPMVVARSSSVGVANVMHFRFCG